MEVCQMKTWRSFLTLTLVDPRSKKKNQSSKILSDSWRPGEVHSPCKHFGGESKAIHFCGRREGGLAPFEWNNLIENSMYSTLLVGHDFYVWFGNSYVSFDYCWSWKNTKKRAESSVSSLDDWEPLLVTWRALRMSCLELLLQNLKGW